MAHDLLELRNVSVSYGKVVAVSEVSLQVGAGQIVTVIGPNGAGKTTLLCAIMGVLPAQGEIVMCQRTCRDAEIEEMVAAGVNLVPEKRELFVEMTVEDNLLLGAFHRIRTGHRDHPHTLEEVFTLFPRLRERRRQLAGTLSGGERQMLAMARALIAGPSVLLLDEPSLGLAPIVTADLMRTIKELCESRELTVILVEQDAMSALRVSERAVVLHVGKVAADDTAEVVSNDANLRHYYLGIAQ